MLPFNIYRRKREKVDPGIILIYLTTMNISDQNGSQSQEGVGSWRLLTWWYLHLGCWIIGRRESQQMAPGGACGVLELVRKYVNTLLSRYMSILGKSVLTVSVTVIPFQFIQCDRCTHRIGMACDFSWRFLVKCVLVKFRSFKIEVRNSMGIKAYLCLQKEVFLYFKMH